MMYPWLPTVSQLINLVGWLANLRYGFCENASLLFIWSGWVGFHYGTSYTNFLFLACARTNLSCDMHLNYYERELVVNLLLISDSIGSFLSGALTFGTLMVFYPDIIFNSPV